MTLPDERTKALLMAKDFLYALLDPKETPRVPRAIRMRARACLKHYPHLYELEEVAKKAPGVFGSLRGG